MRLLFALFLLLPSEFALSQHVVLSTDSLKLVFPNKVYVALQPAGDGKQFLMSKNALQILLVQSNYLYDRIQHISETSTLLARLLHVRDSTIKVLQTKNTISQERVDVYSNAYQESKAVSQDYNKLTDSLLKDASDPNKSKRRNKRKYFMRGVVSGVVAGVLISVLYFTGSN